jgi:N-methylhydantoinase A
VRLVSTSKRLDPADYTLVAYGGAGPLHAASVAVELGISTILIPAGPGILCAFGVLTKDVAMDLSMSRLMTDDGDDFSSKVRQVFGELERRAERELKSSGASVADLQFT